MVKRCLLIMGLALALPGCAGSAIDFAGMAEAERAHNERMSKEVLAFMSLETMFPDPQVRALAEAAGKGNIRKVEELVAQGVDVNSRGKKNATPLFWSMSNIKGFKRLWELGADPNVVFGEGGPVMHWAAKFDDTAFLKAAIEHGGDVELVAGIFGETPIFKALSNRDAMIFLLDSGANINARSQGNAASWIKGGDTPVMTAATTLQYEVVYELLVRGADYTVKNEIGIDLAHRVASKRGVFIPGSDQAKWLAKVIAWLEERGVNIRELFYDGRNWQESSS